MRWSLGFFPLLFLFAACVAAKPVVLSSFLPLTAHALAVAGEDARVEQLLPPGINAHDYQVRPGDARRVAEADLVLVNGLGLDAWVEPLIRQAMRPGARLVDASTGMHFLPKSERLRWTETPAAAHDHSDCAGCASAGGDGLNPHVWLDPLLAISQARTIAEALAEADPAHAEGYRLRFEAYAADLRALHEETSALLAPLKGRGLVTFHDAFPYFAARYGLNYIGALEAFPGREPTPRELATLANAIRDNHVDVIFSEQGYDPRLLQALARQTGARITHLDTLETGTPGPRAYIEGMRANVRVLVNAWTVATR